MEAHGGAVRVGTPLIITLLRPLSTKITIKVLHLLLQFNIFSILAFVELFLQWHA
jgi:hypothetical protein